MSKTVTREDAIGAALRELLTQIFDKEIADYIRHDTLIMACEIAQFDYKLGSTSREQQLEELASMMEDWATNKSEELGSHADVLADYAAQLKAIVNKEGKKSNESNQ